MAAATAAGSSASHACGIMRRRLAPFAAANLGSDGIQHVSRPAPRQAHGVQQLSSSHSGCSHRRRPRSAAGKVWATTAGGTPAADTLQQHSSQEGSPQQTAADAGSAASSVFQVENVPAVVDGRLEGRWSYKMVKAQPIEILVSELRRRRLPTWGRKDQVASRVYTALGMEGRALGREESAAAEAAMGLLEGGGTGTGFDSGWESGEESGGAGGGAIAAGEAASSALLEQNPLLALQSSPAGRFLTESNQERLLSNAGALQLFFLWGGAAPNGIKHSTSCLVRTSKSVWLFDCGEDAQRHLVRNQAVAWAKLERIFVSSLSPDTVLGLPGMLCTISAAREKGHETADMPLHVYGPQGLADYVNTMLSVSRTYLEMPVIIHELVATAVPPEQVEELTQINSRARLYVTRLPPDQLNPEGYYDAEIRTMLARFTRKRSRAGKDLRAGTLPLPLPPPGNPRRTGLRVAELSWSLRMDHEWLVRVAPLRNKQPTFGFMLQEADRSGRLYVDRAVELGVEPGLDFTRLKSGEPVTTPDGSTVYPEQCVGPVRRGRRVAIIGSCLDSSTFATSVMSSNLGCSSSSDGDGSDGSSGSSAAGDDAAGPLPCDLVIHSMSYPTGAPPGTPRSAAALAGATAAALCAKEVVLWQSRAGFVDSPDGSDESFPEEVTQQAKEALGSEFVSLAGCYWCYQPEREEERLLPPAAPAAAAASQAQ